MSIMTSARQRIGFVLLAIVNVAYGGWEIETVIPERSQFPSYPSIAMKPDQYPAVTYGMYYGGAGWFFLYSEKISEGWISDTIEIGGGVSEIEIDKNGGIHIGARSPDAVEYITKENGEWVIDSIAGEAMTFSFALSPQNKPAFAFPSPSRHDSLVYAEKYGDKWFYEVVDREYPYIDLAFNPSGMPEIVANKRNGFYLFKGRWSKDTIPDFSIESGTFPSLIIDRNGREHIFCMGKKEGEEVGIIHIWYDGNWRWEMVDEEGSVDSYLRFGRVDAAMDRDGNFHLVYNHHCEGIPDTLFYAFYNGNTWMKEPVDAVSGHHYAIAVNTLCISYILYYRDGEVKCAKRDKPPVGIKERKVERWEIPDDRMLSINPNPFAKQTVISFQLSGKTRVNLKVYDVSGRLVRTLLRTKGLEHRAKSMTWDGRDDKGQLLPSGVYFIRFKTADYSKTQKVILFR